jgi:MFS family permease
MSIRPSLSILKWGNVHKHQLAFITSAGVIRCGSSIAYAVLTVVIARFYGDWVSAVMIGVFNIYQSLVTDPIAGGLSDKIGSKWVVMAGAVMMGLAGVFWIVFPSDNLMLLTIFALLLFTSYSCRDEVYAYLLRTSSKSEGGFVFGVAENLFAVSTFIGTLTLPYFIASDHDILAAVVMIGTGLASVSLIIGLPNDRVLAKNRFIAYNPVAVIKRGWHFVKVNRYFPTLSLANSAFEGIFYGTVWLIMPLKIATGESGILAGLTLGVYELITIFAAGYAGYLADKYNWVKINAIGWALAGVGSIALLFSDSVWWLVLIGAVVAVGNNLFAFAASHALESNDIDHQEDGSFIGINNLMVDLGYGLAPLIIGGLYAVFGAGISLGLASIVTVSLAIIMIPLAYRLNSRNRRTE